MEFTCEGNLCWTFVYWEFLNHWFHISTCIIVGLFIFFSILLLSLERLYLPKNLSISSKLYILLAYSCLWAFIVHKLPTFWARTLVFCCCPQTAAYTISYPGNQTFGFKLNYNTDSLEYPAWCVQAWGLLSLTQEDIRLWTGKQGLT